MSEQGDTTTQQGAEGTDSGEDQGQTADPQFQALTDRMDQFTQQIGGNFDELREALAQQQAPGGDELGQDDGLFDDLGQQFDGFDQDVDPRQAQEAHRALEQMIEQKAQGLVAPLQQQLDIMRVRGEAKDVASRYPKLDQPEVAKAAFETAGRFAQQLGMPQLAHEPAFIERIYLAGLAEETAAQETPAGGQDGIRLEGAGAGAPDLGQAADEFGDRIVGAGPKSVFGGG